MTLKPLSMILAASLVFLAATSCYVTKEKCRVDFVLNQLTKDLPEVSIDFSKSAQWNLDLIEKKHKPDKGCNPGFDYKFKSGGIYFPVQTCFSENRACCITNEPFFEILVNANNQILFENSYMDLNSFESHLTKRFIDSNKVIPLDLRIDNRAGKSTLDRLFEGIAGSYYECLNTWSTAQYSKALCVLDADSQLNFIRQNKLVIYLFGNRAIPVPPPMPSMD